MQLYVFTFSCIRFAYPIGIGAGNGNGIGTGMASGREDGAEFLCIVHP